MTVIIKVNTIQIETFQDSELRGGTNSLCCFQRNETWKEGLKTFEKY